jgi:hypothetical protein
VISSKYLRIRFRRDNDGTGELTVEAASEGFLGRSSAWFSVAALEEFARAIAVFPLANERRPAITGGYCTPDRIEQEHVGITVYPIDALGHIGVQIRMATAFERGMRPESQHSAKIEVLTTYAPLARFSRELLGVLDGSLNEAVLSGDT